VRITYLNSASVLIQDKNVKIMCDPWLDGEEYFGSWGIYPPYNFKPEDFDDVDFIHISHIHPDHCSLATLSKLNKKISIVIHKFPEKFLKVFLEKLGFSVIELEHNKRTKLKDDVYLTILAADNCNPEICGKLMGCSNLGKNLGTTQIDTMSIIDNKKEVIVNTNDCPFPIAEQTALMIKKQYPIIDFLLVGYVKASSYPQCFDLDEDVKLREAEIKQENKLQTAIQYIELFRPKFFMPFAGRYTLTGKNTNLNKFRGEPELEYAYEYLIKNVSNQKSTCVVLNHDCNFDISSGTQSKSFIPVNFNEKNEYVKQVFSKLSYEYEKEPYPSEESLQELLPTCYENFEKVRKEINWTSETKIILKIGDNLFAVISCNGLGYEICSSNQLGGMNHYLKMNIDSRLLKWILQGPRKAHWSIADIGCHINYKRVPNTYERGLYYCWNHFYSNNYS
jgi:UDP-MurNAc hydroxylase